MICLACGTPMTQDLEWSGSLRCHDCRDARVPLQRALVAEAPPLVAEVASWSAREAGSELLAA